MDWNEDTQSDSDQSDNQASTPPAPLPALSKAPPSQDTQLLQILYFEHKCSMLLDAPTNLSLEKQDFSNLGILNNLIQFYAKCIIDAEQNIGQLIKYFQLKIKQLSNHYQRLSKTISHDLGPYSARVHDLGGVEEFIPSLQKYMTSLNDPHKDIPDFVEKRLNLSQNVMAVLQKQNLHEHIVESKRKAEVMQKTIQNELHLQEMQLEERRRKNNDKHGMSKISTASSLLTSATTSPCMQSQTMTISFLNTSSDEDRRLSSENNNIHSLQLITSSPS